MELSIRTDSIELTDSLRDLVTRRIRLALNKFEGRIVDTFVYLMGLNSPKEDRNKLCLMSVRVHGLGETVVRETASTEAAALDRAVRRVKHRVSAALRDAGRPSTEFGRPKRTALNLFGHLLWLRFSGYNGPLLSDEQSHGGR